LLQSGDVPLFHRRFQVRPGFGGHLTLRPWMVRLSQERCQPALPIAAPPAGELGAAGAQHGYARKHTRNGSTFEQAQESHASSSTPPALLMLQGNQVRLRLAHQVGRGNAQRMASFQPIPLQPLCRERVLHRPEDRYVFDFL
jgi:hypothetical protein